VRVREPFEAREGSMIGFLVFELVVVPLLGSSRRKAGW
jgi:hypothetical protein